MLLRGAVKGSIFGMICVLIIALALLFEITGVEVYGFTHLFEITGIEVLPDGVKKNSKVMALPGHFDLPARAGVTEQVTYIGHDSCCYCDEHGDVVKTGARGHVMTFPFRNTTSGHARPQTAEEVKTHSFIALENNRTVSITLLCCIVLYKYNWE